MTGLGFRAVGRVNIVLEPLQDKHFNSDVGCTSGMYSKRCEECSRLSTSLSRRARGTWKGWVQPRAEIIIGNNSRRVEAIELGDMASVLNVRISRYGL
eukprot:6467726-Amphidinium_carterae.1